MKKLLLFSAAMLPLGLAAENSSSVSRVYDFCPAPGQFVNVLPAYVEGDTQETMNQKALEALQGNGMICLGSYGGYVVMGWDHRVVNVPGEYDFKILGNAYANNNEAGIIMVSVDANGNSLPDDPWYEIAGSEYSKPETLHDYSVTYTLPDDDLNSSYPWTSNDPDAASGEVARNSFHTQSYWPAWRSETYLTFEGTRLRSYGEKSGALYTFPNFEFGYADNLGMNDEPGVNIDWAVLPDGTPANLRHIDFVKVYTGSMQCTPTTGDVSTEISSATDLHPDAVETFSLQVADFEGLPFPEGSDTWDGSATADPDELYTPQLFANGSFWFLNFYCPEYASWESWGYSRTTASDFPGYVVGQFNSACGGGHDSDTFGVLFGGNFYGPNAVSIDSEEDQVVPGAYITNNAYVYDAVVNGDGMGGLPFGAGDWMKMTLSGKLIDGSDAENTVDIYLADYRSENPEEWTLLKDWTWFDLSGLGAVNEIHAVFTSSRNNSWGNLMPAYACVDDLGANSPEQSGLSTVAPAGSEGYTVNGLTVTLLDATAQIELYTPAGSLAATGRSSVTAPAPGLYILRTPSLAASLLLR